MDTTFCEFACFYIAPNKNNRFSNLTHILLCFVFLGARIDKRVEKNIQNKIWADIFYSDLHVYMAEGYD